MGDMVEVRREDLERANRLIDWMAGYIGQMAPGHYSACYADLNEHFIAMGVLGIGVKKEEGG